MAVSGFLKEVVSLKKSDVAEAERIISLKEMRQQAEELLSRKAPGYRTPFSFRHAIEERSAVNAGVIAEIKKASPSKGDIRVDLDPAEYAKKYTAAGACAISVLTEKHYFKGSLEDLKAVRAVTDIPVLRKDFTLSSYQIYEAKAAGADTVLLITVMLSKDQLRDYVALARELGMEPLVEIHSEWELENAIYADARIIGINNRNLQTLETDINVAKRVVPFFTENQIAVEASGISSPDDIRKGIDAGIFSFLVGESIVRAENTKEFVRSLVTAGRGDDLERNSFSDRTEIETEITTENGPDSDNSPSKDCGTAKKKRELPSNRYFSKKKRPAVKICGLTSVDEAVACVKAGADAIGFIFYPPSPRYISPELAAAISAELPDDVMTTGVFVDENLETVIKIAKESGLKAVQLHGNESPDFVKRVADDGLVVIKGLFAGREPHISDAALYDHAHAILVEYGKGVLPGGNGESWDWKLAVQPDASGDEAQEIRIILAGGLNPDNIENAVSSVRPWGIDLSSGVEISPGRKDIGKVEKLISGLESSL